MNGLPKDQLVPALAADLRKIASSGDNHGIAIYTIHYHGGYFTVFQKPLIHPKLGFRYDTLITSDEDLTINNRFLW